MRRILALFLAYTLSAVPLAAEARPKAAAAAPRRDGPDFDQAAFTTDYNAATAARTAGRFAEAARMGHSAGRHVPEVQELRNDRAELYKAIASDFLAATDQAEDEALLREAVDTLDGYIAGFEAAYPGEVVKPEVSAARAELQSRLTALETARRPPPPVVVPAPTPAPAPETKPAPRPGRGLQIAGGVSFGVGAVVWLAMLPVGYRDMNDATYTPGNAAHTEARRLTITGWVVGSMFLAAGVSMLVVGTVRKSGRTTVAPAVSATSFGLSWQGRF